MTVKQPAPVALEPPQTGQHARSRMFKVTGGLTLVNGTVALLALITGPLQARALGPAGRGTLAAILVPVGVVPVLALMGLGAYAAVAPARGKPAGALLGSVGGAAAVAGIIFALLGIPIAGIIAHGRVVVHTFLLINFAALPLTLPAMVLQWMLVGQQRWRWFVLATMTQPVVVTAGIVVLFILEDLTVRATAILAFAGLLLGLLPALGALRGGGRIRFDLSLAREGVSFGARAWVGQLTSLTNVRLDQLLMAGLVPARQLGLYAVAAALATVVTMFTGAVGPPLVARIAAGDRTLARRALRVTLAVAVGVTAISALTTPLIVPLLFGAAFKAAIPMAIVVLLAAVPFAGVTVLTVALVADGRPGLPALCEAITIVITVVGLLILLPVLGGFGAALVSLVAYSTNFVLQLTFAKRRFGGRMREFMLPASTDLAWARGQLSGLRLRPWMRG